MNDIYETLDRYGVVYSGDQGYSPTEGEVYLSELAEQGGKITKVRWIGGDYVPGRGKCWDISYIHGVLADGTPVRLIDGPSWWSLVPKHKMKSVLIEWAKEEGVFAKGVGLLDEGRWSVLG